MNPLEAGKLRSESRKSSREAYLGTLLLIKKVCNDFHLDHRFVGGTLTDLLDPQTQVSIDFPNRRLYLVNYPTLSMFRSDGTIKDVDLICFCPDLLAVQGARNLLEERRKAYKRQNKPFPLVSLEATHFPGWPQRRKFTQFVSGLDADGGGILYLTFDKIRQPIDWETVKPWRVVLTEDGNATLTTLNPFAHALRYCMRVPSGVKRKDKEIKTEGETRFNKMSLMLKLGMQVAHEAEKAGVDYKHELYRPWIDFIQAMMHDQSLPIAFKRWLTGTYWDTIGTALAHGKGILGPFARLGDKFSG